MRPNTVQISSDLLSARKVPPPLPGYLLLVHYTSRGARKRFCECMCWGEKGATRARVGQVSLKNRVAIPVSTWRKMKRAFHAPTLFSRFLVINSSASHYDEFPRERTQHKLQISTAGLRYGRLNSVFLSNVFHINKYSQQIFRLFCAHVSEFLLLFFYCILDNFLYFYCCHALSWQNS